MSEERKPSVSMEEHLKMSPLFIDGNKELEEQGISSMIIPAHEQLSPEELKARQSPPKK